MAKNRQIFPFVFPFRSMAELGFPRTTLDDKSRSTYDNDRFGGRYWTSLDSILACPEGLEPPTPSLEGWCSIQLSYGQIGR